MNIIKIIAVAASLATPSMCYSQISKDSALQTINEFNANENADKLLQCLTKIEREPSLDENSRAELFVKILATSIQYLERHPKPAETPQLNIAPPDGSMAGADPASIKDPVARAKYEKEIAANKTLAELYRQHNSISAVRDKIIAYCVSFSKLKTENKKLISDSIRDASNDPKTEKTIKTLMENQEAGK